MPRILFVSGFHPSTRARDLAYEFERYVQSHHFFSRNFSCDRSCSTAMALLYDATYQHHATRTPALTRKCFPTFVSTPLPYPVDACVPRTRPRGASVVTTRYERERDLTLRM